MAKKKIKKVSKRVSIFKNSQYRTVFGAFLTLFALFLVLSIVSYFFNWEVDQSTLSNMGDKNIKASNLLGKAGALFGEFFVYKGFGISSLTFAFLLFFTGMFILLETPVKKLYKYWFGSFIVVIWISVTLGFLSGKYIILSGIIGFEINEYLQAFIGKSGLWILLVFIALTYVSIVFKLSLSDVIAKLSSVKTKLKDDIDSVSDATANITVKGRVESSAENKPKADSVSFDINQPKGEDDNTVNSLTSETVFKVDKPKVEETLSSEDLTIKIKQAVDEDRVDENLADKLVADFGEFDPTLELHNFQFPSLNLLKEYNETISVDSTELEENKNRIVETLNNYKIGITQIKATVGPTVTLYEIIPEAGVRISKIKNLEDDIALSLSALGIRIIAPIPGKGTIGIEVPNNSPTVVSIKSVLSSKKFQEANMHLPIALGKNISNETVVVDLAKMPHLLMAGATGQGKSVGLNTVLASILYKKHPAEVKFVLIDPKKVELTLFNKIERHYLAKLPNSEDAIITDTKKVVNTLNSLCIEMDNRYELLKNAYVRNIAEYNEKFKKRKLNPEDGHSFMPYIVLVIDEFADLIMTAGKEVEMPIARIAQLARAIGIHLIVATQRPSVNVITGVIKANFPARIAFRVSSKIDSRTILDGPGADQLIGKGDMLYSGGNEVIRIQCAFIDTPEVEAITDFIGSQKAYPDAYLLPEYVGEEGEENIDIDIADRDKMFYEAAMVIINAQQGSTSLIQRKLKLGYNRSGRIIDQLEAAGIVGQFEGSKARKVLVLDEMALKTLLENE